MLTTCCRVNTGLRISYRKKFEKSIKTAFSEKGIKALGDYNRCDPLLKEIVKFFQIGVSPVTPDETLEIYTFVEVADESKHRDGRIVSLNKTKQKAFAQTG